jgi:hypothetical protein
MRKKFGALLLGALLLALSSTAVFAQNLVANGNFAADNSGFYSQYTYSPGNLLPENVYDVATDPAADNPYWSYTGGTPAGAGSENMLIVNGGLVGNNIVWGENGLTVKSNTNYNFSVEILNLYPVSPATLNFTINGAPLGMTFTPGLAVGKWIPFYATWNSGSSTSASLELVDTNTALTGNDFALDLVCLSATSSCAVGTSVGGTGTGSKGAPEPATWALMLLGFGALALTRNRRSLMGATANA